jgi:hypothetical protein
MSLMSCQLRTDPGRAGERRGHSLGAFSKQLAVATRDRDAQWPCEWLARHELRDLYLRRRRESIQNFVDARDGPLRKWTLDQPKFFSAPNEPLSTYAEIPPGATRFDHAFRELRQIPPPRDLPTRTPRLRDLDQGGADFVHVTDARGGFDLARNREVLTERRRFERSEPGLQAPRLVVVGAVDADGFVRPAVHSAIRLTIAIQIFGAQHHRAFERTLEEPGVPAVAIANEPRRADRKCQECRHRTFDMSSLKVSLDVEGWMPCDSKV